MKTYKDLIVWQKGVELTIAVYVLTKSFPVEEQFGLTSQMRRAAVSIPANIAEGKLRQSGKEFRRFLYIAFGSGGELETHLVIAKQLHMGASADYERIDTLLNEVMRMLNVMISKASA